MRIFRIGNEPFLHTVSRSAVHGIAARRYTPEQCEAWIPTDYDVAQRHGCVRRIQPFVAEPDAQPVAYVELQADEQIDHFSVSDNHMRQDIEQQLMSHILGSTAQCDTPHVQVHVHLNAEPLIVHNGSGVVIYQAVTVRGSCSITR